MRIVVALCAWLVLHGSAGAAEPSPPVDGAVAPEADAGADGDVPAPDAAPVPLGTPAPVPQMADSPPAPPPGRILPTDPAAIKEGAPGPDEWPIEYVLRPQTVPAGRLQVDVTGSITLIDGDFRSPGGVKYWSWGQAGVATDFGISDRLEFSSYIPRLLCADVGEPSGCSRYARINGSGVGFGYGLVRTRPFQLVLTTNASIALTNPMTLQISGGARAKVLVAGRLALLFGLSARKWLDAPPGYAETAFGTVLLEPVLQVTHNLDVWLGLEPNSALDHLSEPRLTPWGGIGWTFENAVELSASGGVFNVLARRPWDSSLPGKYVELDVGFWI
jgi:hypothetical protein